MLKKLTVTLLFLGLFIGAKAQYGFEWIKPYQPYYKFKIWEEGVYKIDSLKLVQAGINLLNVNPNRIQLFKNGEELPVFIQGAQDGVFNQSDFIEFYGEPNNGKLDTELYKTSQDQPHIIKSLFTDTAVYFITILPDTTVIAAKRYTLQNDTNYLAFTAEPNYKQTVNYTLQEEYYRGASLPASEKYYISEYAGAEGWTSYLFGQNQPVVYDVKTPNAITTGTVTVNIKVIGASDFFVNSPSIPNHHIRIYAGPTINPTTLIADTTYNGYGERIITKTISANLLGSVTYFKFEVVNDINVGSDFNALSYINLNYTKNGNVGNATLQSIELNSFLSSTKNRLDFTNFTGNFPAFLDLTLQQKVLAAKQGTNIIGLFNYTNQPRKYVLYNQSETKQIGQITAVNFLLVEPNQNYEYLLITNDQLLSSAQQYKQYRDTKYKTFLVTTNQLFDYYFYGNNHPLALKRFTNHLLTQQTQKPQFLLLLGRGYQNNLTRNNAEIYNKNLVPAIGEPSSDNLYTANQDGIPQIATGRIPAANNQDVLNYLNKLVLIETNFDTIAQWRKHFLHLSGGTFLGEQQQFTGVVNTLRDVVLQKPTGAKVFGYHKNTTLPTQTNLRENLISHLNNGTNVMTFLGHGSLTVLDMDFGGINDLIPNNKPTFFYFNGCNIGNANDVDPNGTGLVYGKDYITAANKGAIGWLAHSNLTLTGLLYTQMYKFYDQIGKFGYGLPVGLNIKTALQNAVVSNDAYSKSHALQLLLQGDPAYVVYGPSLPDAKIADNDLFITPNNANAQMDSFAVGIIVNNIAKATLDTIEITCKRTLPNNSVIDYLPLKVNLPNYADTFYFWIKVLDKNEVGNNKFDISINPNKTFTESNYNNNAATLNFFLPGSGIQLIKPYKYNLFGTDSVEFLVQNNNLFAPATEYLFELDTSILFNPQSSYFKSSGIVMGNTIAKWLVKMPNEYKTYYWRAKINAPENMGGTWQLQSFSITNESGGPRNIILKNKYYQHKNTSKQEFIIFNDTLQKTEFSDNEFILGIENRRWDHRRMGVTIPYLLNAGVGNCVSQGTVVLVFNQFQLDFPAELPNYPFNCAYVQSNKFDPSVRYYPFNTNTTQGEDELKALIDSVPQGYYVAMFSRYSSNINNWKSSTLQSLNLIGSNTLQHVKSANTAWAIIGQKGAQIGTAVEDTIINNELENTPNLPPQPTDPQDEKFLRIKKTILQKWHTGSYTTDLIGPAKQWIFASVNVEPKTTGRFWFDIIANNGTDKDTVCYSNLTSFISLNAIDASKYKFIKIRFNFVDSTERKPHQLKDLNIGYVPSAEATINPALGYYFYKDELNRGDSVIIHVPIQNIGYEQLDSTDVEIDITDENRISKYQFKTRLGYVNKNEFSIVKHKVSTAFLGNKNVLNFSVNKNQKVAEVNYNNNLLNTSFTVSSDTKNPYLEVTIDGQKIMNGDIVSPNPIIKITSTDDNKYLVQNDTSTFNLFFKQANQQDYERLPHSHTDVEFVPANKDNNTATLFYKPKNLVDGLYSLKVQASDVSGNKAGADDYEIDFNVINKSSISHFYPYPNPFTTSTRFVFTLTGSEVPTDLMVRIFTVSGKLIREVNKQEFGSIHIGNNISEFAWDGTDMFGDKLANGVYLYQVLTRINGNKIEHRNTRAKEENQYFINNTGKIYLMR